MMNHQNPLRAGVLATGAILGLVLTAPSARANFDVSGLVALETCSGFKMQPLPSVPNGNGSINITTPPANAGCAGPGESFSNSGSAGAAADDALSTLSVTGSASGLGSRAQANAGLGVTLTLTPPADYAGGPIEVGFGSTYQMSLTSGQGCDIHGLCITGDGAVGIGWSVKYTLNGQAKNLLHAVDLNHTTVPANVELTTGGMKSGIGTSALIMMDCCGASFTTDVGIDVENGFSGSVSDPLNITVPSGWSYSLAPGPVIPFPVPEAGTFALFASGLVTLAVRRSRACA